MIVAHVSLPLTTLLMTGPTSSICNESCMIISFCNSASYLHAHLLHCRRVSQCYRVRLGLRVKVDGHAKGHADLVKARISSANRSATLVHFKADAVLDELVTNLLHDRLQLLVSTYRQHRAL